MSTLAEEALYRACGYQEIERTASAPDEGVAAPLIRMAEPLEA